MEESEEDASTQEVGDEIIASPENVEIGAVSATVQEQEVEGVEDQVMCAGSRSVLLGGIYSLIYTEVSMNLAGKFTVSEVFSVSFS